MTGDNPDRGQSQPLPTHKSDLPCGPAAVREALAVSVALVTRDVEHVDIPPAVLLESADTDLVAQVLACIVSALLEAALPDGGRQLLIRIGRRAAEGGRP